MAAAKDTVVIGFLGTTLDAAARGVKRWDRWRPTVALCSHEDLVVHRLELLYDRRHGALADVVAEDVRQVSPETSVRGYSFDVRDPWDFEEVFGALHDFARAYTFRPEREQYLLHITTGTHVAQICMFLLAESRHLPARLIQTSPPRREQHDSGPGSYAIIDLDLSRYDRLASRFKAEQREATSFLKSGIETRNATFNRLIERIEQVAGSSRAPILLTGPTGAGKSQLAKRIFELKRLRRKVAGDFVEVNCATLRGDTAMSALFGHVRGAFTGALQDRPGLLRKANGGVLFLDEIGELGPDEQAMLLRALEEKVFFPLGSDKEVKSDFELIAGSNRDLPAAVASGRFREDLHARINLWTFRLPALRERPEDIPPNLDYELEQAPRTVGTRVTFNREARERFLGFATSPEGRWPGNFRDFNAAILRMATLAAGGRIGVELVEEEIARLRAAWAPAPGAGRGPGAADEAIVAEALGDERAAGLDRFDLVQLAEVLRACREARSLSAAGRALFAASRSRKTSVNDADRLCKYLARFGIEWRILKGEPVMPIPPPSLPQPTIDRLEKIVASQRYPFVFATVSGAHLYGFGASADSDFDLRGAHVLPVQQVVGLDPPVDETLEVSSEVNGLDLDLVSSDVHKFFTLLLKRNGYALEQLLSPLVVHSTVAHEELLSLARGCVTRHHAQHYLGFFKTQWKLFGKEEPPRVKPLLYAYRVLLTGIHLMRTGEVEANLPRLNDIFRLPYIPELITRKLEGRERSVLTGADHSFHAAEVTRLVKELETAAERSKLPDAPSAGPKLNELLVKLRGVWKGP